MLEVSASRGREAAMTPLRATVLLFAVLVLGGCHGETVPAGAWGGDHVVLTVTDNGGSVEFDCASGTLDHPLRLDDRGRFSVPGTFVPQHPGATRTSDAAQSRPARYQGRLDRQKLEFTVTVEGETGQGPYTVTLAKAPKITKCA
jgi:hypothetical protein